MPSEIYQILFPLALILIVSKLLSKICEKIGLPSVVGLLVAGILIGLIRYIPGQTILNSATQLSLGTLAKIGVVLLLFTAGIETDIKQIKTVGLPSFIIAVFGVIVPLGLGFLVAMLFGEGDLLSSLFYGVVLTATSVSVTVAVLKEMGKLNGKAGATIISAAILDDIIGIIVLSFIIALKGGGEAASPIHVLIMIILFFVFMGVVGTFASKLFNYIERKFPHHRLLAIFSIGFCFLAAYISEEWFGVADITGAFAAGLFLSRNPEVAYIDRKADIMGYMIFTPVFFCNIGISTSFSGLNGKLFVFGLCLIAAGIIGKLLGCGLSSLACKYSFKDSLCIGIGMVARAEVALVCAQKGVDVGLINPGIMPFIVIMIIISSLLAPISLKSLFSSKTELIKQDNTQIPPVKLHHQHS